jgi:protein translocase SecG subunit
MFDTLQITMVIISVLLIVVVLIQNKNVALNLTSMSGGMAENVKRGPEKVLDVTTKILGALFIVNAVALFLLSN